MGDWHAALPEELARLWPAVRASHLFTSMPEFDAFYRNGPWRVRVSGRGDGMVLARWRRELPVLAMKGAWAASHRTKALVQEAASVARSQGYESLVSPLLSEPFQAPYIAAGMHVREHLVVLQGISTRLGARAARQYRLRRATQADAAPLASADAECFEPFWRHSIEEWAEATERERVTVAEQGGTLLGYTSATIHGSVCTLGRLGVLPAARRNGVGRLLVKDVLGFAAAEGLPIVSLCTQEGNAASRALYSSVGLVELEEHHALLECDVRSAPLSDTL